MADFERHTAALRRMVDNRLRALLAGPGPNDLREGCRYVLAGGGKRLRSVLVLLSAEAAGGRARDAVDAGAAVELLHNFTLVHDDVMDHADTRRGRPTVHRHWDLNTALLVGDVLLGLGYDRLLRSPSRRLPALLRIYTEGLLEVCEGQALDLEFERRDDVTPRAYYRMIEKKTARLIAMACELGGHIGGARPAKLAALREFGFRLGRAFQLQDDLLDVVAEEAEFGKTIGGDILEGKKTWLTLRALSDASPRDRAALRRLVRKPPPGTTRDPRSADSRSRVAAAAALYRKYGVLDAAARAVGRDTAAAVRALELLPDTAARRTLHRLAGALLHRSF